MRLALAWLLLAAACAPALPPWEPDAGLPAAPEGPNPFVHQQGTGLVDGAGLPVSLRGVNLGGWLLWEAWIWGGGFSNDGQSKLVSRLAEVVGDAEAQAFVQRVADNYVTEEDIALIARLGFNAVRVPFNHRLVEDDAGAPRPEGLAVLDRLIGWCEAHGVVAVLDLHATPGGQSRWFMADPDDVRLWDSKADQDRTVALWRSLALRYRDRAGVAGYDLINEPDPPSGEALLALDRRIAAAIREVDARHLILVEGSTGASDFSAFTGPVTFNQAYSFHQYTWFGDSRREELDRYKAMSERHGFPLWAGEFGENAVAMIGSTQAMYAAPGSGISGSAFWTWKKVPNGQPHLLGITARMPDWEKLIAWMNGGWTRPTADEARLGMDEFIRGVAVAECELDPSMARALGGTP